MVKTVIVKKYELEIKKRLVHIMNKDSNPRIKFPSEDMAIYLNITIGKDCSLQFIKQDNDIKLGKRSTNYLADEIFYLLTDILEEMYDELSQPKYDIEKLSEIKDVSSLIKISN